MRAEKSGTAAQGGVRLVGVALTAAALVGGGLAGCGPVKSSSRPAATSPSASTMPRACQHLREVRTAVSDPPAKGDFLISGEVFGPFEHGEPYLVITLDDRGLHFSPTTVAYGDYNVCFVESRRVDAHHDVSFTFFVSGPRMTMASVQAGTIGGGVFCPGAESWGVFIDDGATTANIPSADNLTVNPGPGCRTVVT